MALSAIEHALTLNASCATAHYFAALVNAFADQPDAAAFHANRALRLSPFDPSAFEAHLAIGMGALRAGHTTCGLVRQGLANQPPPQPVLFLPRDRACARGRAGRRAVAPTRARAGPGFRIRIFAEFGMAPPLAEAFSKGARLLGLPE